VFIYAPYLFNAAMYCVDVQIRSRTVLLWLQLTLLLTPYDLINFFQQIHQQAFDTK